MARAPHPDDIRAELVQVGADRERITRDVQESIVELGAGALRARAAGLSVREIMALTGASRATVYAAMERSSSDP